MVSEVHEKSAQAKEARTQRPLCVAIVGATGAVGEVLLEVLVERDFPVGEVRPLASCRSAGQTVRFRGREIEVKEVSAGAFEGADIAFFAATGSLSKELAPAAVRAGAVAIDKSNSWRMDPDVPLVIPEVNGKALAGHRGIIACPNCTTIGVVMALEPIRRVAGVPAVVVTTLQAVSGAGRDGAVELQAQLDARAAQQEPVRRVFAATIAGNVIPLCERFLASGYSSEEMKLLHESRKILELPDLRVSMTCVRVPVTVGHSSSLLVETDRPIEPAAAREALSRFPGVEVVDDTEDDRFPTPLDVVGRDEVLVGRVRRDCASDRLWLWQVVDNLRKGAATNAVQIAEALHDRNLLLS